MQFLSGNLWAKFTKCFESLRLNKFSWDPAQMIEEEYNEINCQNIDISGFLYQRVNGLYVANNETFNGRISFKSRH